MSRCFISYRHVSPDQELAHALAATLVCSGHTVFVDTKLEVGARWVDEIEREIKAAQFFTVLLSQHSICSDMVRQEVALAHQQQLAIFPIRVAFRDRLPYDLAAYLNPFQHTLWEADDPFDAVCAEIAAAIHHRGAASAATPPIPSGIQFDPENLDRLTRELAAFVGPVARVLVNRAAKQAHNWQQLLDALSNEIPAGQERKNFLAKRASR